MRFKRTDNPEEITYESDLSIIRVSVTTGEVTCEIGIEWMSTSDAEDLGEVIQRAALQAEQLKIGNPPYRLGSEPKCVFS